MASEIPWPAGCKTQSSEKFNLSAIRKLEYKTLENSITSLGDAILKTPSGVGKHSKAKKA